MCAKNMVAGGGRGKSAVRARCFWPLTGPQEPALGTHFCLCCSFARASFANMLKTLLKDVSYMAIGQKIVDHLSFFLISDQIGKAQ